MDYIKNRFDPRIYLAIDNCFASKRWTEPGEWCGVIRDLGISYIEASADNECDPLYTTPDYLDDWIDKIKQSSEKHGTKVVNLYSGHGTYATLGLSHPDIRIRDRIQHEWLEVMIRKASLMNAGLGFFCHAFKNSILQNIANYTKEEKDLQCRLAELADYAQSLKLPSISLEQMYSPQQIPWTINGAFKMLKSVYGQKKAPLYLTIDTAHQGGQSHFVMPDINRLQELIRNYEKHATLKGVWLGPDSAYNLLIRSNGSSNVIDLADKLQGEMALYPHMFSEYKDSLLYEWLKELGCYSPIIHLQQTDGSVSKHLPFTGKTSVCGIVKGDKVLRALSDSYAQEESVGMPPPCREIYLTVEFFADKDAMPVDILQDLAETVSYWRKYVPEDGMKLSELIRNLSIEEQKSRKVAVYEER